MRKIQKMCFLALVGLMVGTSCEKTAQNNLVPVAPTPSDCIEGVVLGRDCPSYLFVSLPKGKLGSYFKIYGVEYTNAIMINNSQIADQSVNLQLGASVFFKLDTSVQEPYKCVDVTVACPAFPAYELERYCIKSISNKSCN